MAEEIGAGGGAAVLGDEWSVDANGRPRIHENAELCRLLLTAAKASVPLEIMLSCIKDAGSGLFAAGDVAAGAEIFRSQPLVNCRSPTVRDVCDFCFRGAASEKDIVARLSGQKTARMMVCTGCRVGRYCSETCQKKAWKSFHKSECGLLKEMPGMPPTTLALYRLLSMRKSQRLNNRQWDAILELESHFDEHSDGPHAEEVLAIAMDAGKRMDCEFTFDVIWHLICIILTNCMNIRPAERDASLGASLDLVVSLINHDCNPNAFVFFEGGQLRVRSLRAISAGEEITVSYADPRLDVLPRQEVLRTTQFFECECSRCVRQLLDHCKTVGQHQEKLKSILEAQKSMMQLATNCTEGCYGILKSNSDELLSQFKTQLDTFQQKGYCKGEWPDHIEPLPTVRMTIAGMYKEAFTYLPALKYALSGCLLGRRRSGPAWVNDLFELTRILIQVSNEPADGIPFTLIGFPQHREMQNLCRGYAVLLCIAAAHTFGGADECGYVTGILIWAANFFDVPDGDEPPLGHPVFAERFVAAQDGLLKWAGVAKGLPLPDTAAVTSMVTQVERLASRIKQSSVS